MADDFVHPGTGDTVFGNTAAPTRVVPAPPPDPAGDFVNPGSGDRAFGQPEEDANKLDIELPFLKRNWRAIKRMVTGEGSMERPELPEMTEWGADLPTPASLRIEGQYMLAGQDTKALADTVKKALPDATIDSDTYGNPIVTWNGKSAYLNKPGMSAADALSILGAGAAALVPAGIIGRIGRLGGTGLMNTIARAPFQFAGQTAADLAQQEGSRLVGSDQPVDLRRALEAGVGGAVAEPLVAAAGTVVRPLVAGARGLLGNQFLTVAGRTVADNTPLAGNMLNRTGQMFLENAGFDLAALPPDVTVGTVRDLMGRIPAAAIGRLTADTPEARTMARNLAGAARFQLPTTAGQVSGERAAIGREDWLAHSEDPTRSVTPATVMQDFRDTQRTALEGAATRLVPGAPTTEANIGLNIAREGRDRLAQMRAAEQTAWDRAGASTGAGVRAELATDPTRVLYFDPGASHTIIDRLREAAGRVGLDPAISELRRVASMLSVPVGREAPGEALAAEIMTRRPARSGRWGGAAFNQGDLQETRKYLTGALADTGFDDAPRRRALREMIGALDDGAEAAVSGGQVAGNPALLGEMRNAIAVSRERFQAYAPRDTAAAAFMDKITTPNVSGQEIIDHLYGGRMGTTQVLDHIDTVFPPGSPMQESLRRGAVQRMLGGTRETPTDLTAAALASRMSKRIAEATNPTGNGFEVTSRLLAPDEIDQLRAFRETLDGIAASGVRNKSGTAYALGDALRHFSTGKFDWLNKLYGDQHGAVSEARRAVSQTVPRMPPRPTDAAPGLFRGDVAPAAGNVAGQNNQVLPTAGRGAFYLRGLLNGSP